MPSSASARALPTMFEALALTPSPAVERNARDRPWRNNVRTRACETERRCYRGKPLASIPFTIRSAFL
jgi:hypothetical protein